MRENKAGRQGTQNFTATCQIPT